MPIRIAESEPPHQERYCRVAGELEGDAGQEGDTHGRGQTGERTDDEPDKNAHGN
jgi:hypothetical protein